MNLSKILPFLYKRKNLKTEEQLNLELKELRESFIKWIESCETASDIYSIRLSVDDMIWKKYYKYVDLKKLCQIIDDLRCRIRERAAIISQNFFNN